MATYYMRADGVASKTQANEANGGSPNSASTSMSMATHNGSSFLNGDIIKLSSQGGIYKNGPSTAYGLRVPTTGTSAPGITYTNVTGETPVIDASLRISVSWTEYEAGKYSATVAALNILWEDEVALVYDGTGVLGSPGRWYYSGTTLYYRPTTGTPADHTLDRGTTASGYGYGVYVGNKSYINIYNLSVKLAMFSIIIESESPYANYSYVSVQGCTVTKSFGGIDFVAPYNSGVAGYHHSYCSAINNNVSYTDCGIRSYNVGGGLSETGYAVYCEYMTVQGNTVDHWGYVAPGSNNLWVNCSTYGSDEEGISFQNPQYCTCTQNIVTNGSWRGIVTYYTNGTAKEIGNTITRNYVHAADMCYDAIGDNSGAGRELNTIAYNIFNGKDGANATRECVAQIDAASSATGLNKFYNNTIYTNSVNFGLRIYLNTCGTWEFKNNIVQGTDYHVFKDNSGGTSYTFTNNLYVSNTGNQFYNGGATNWAGWKAAMTETNSPDPQSPKWVNGSGLFNTATDFQLQADSPCVNAGVSVGLTTDYAGNAIIGNPDIGAWEYVSAPGPTLSIHIGGPDTISIL